MQFVDILTAVYDRTGNSASSVPSDVSRRIKAFVNRWNRKVLSAPLMEPLRRVTITCASIADQPSYGVVLKKINYVYEFTTQREIFKNTLGWYRERFPDPSRFTGTPLFWVPNGQTRILARPSAACELFIVSTAAGTGTVKVEAIRSNGYRVSLSKALTGTTPVSMSTTIIDIIDVVDVRLAAAEAGDVTVTQGSGGNVLSKIPIWQTYPRFLRFTLAPTPAQVITYQIDGIADIVDLANDYDEPFFDADFHDLLVDGAVFEEWSLRGRSREAAALRSEIELRLRSLRMDTLEWPTNTNDNLVERSFDQTIREPIA